MTTSKQLKSQLGLISSKYDNFIDSRKLRTIPKDVYTEKHHIIPKSICVDDSSKNIIILTAREHFIAHLILWKETTGLNHKKMAFAFWGLTQRGHINLNSRQFSILRQEVSKNMSEQQTNFVPINKNGINKWVNYWEEDSYLKEGWNKNFIKNWTSEALKNHIQWASEREWINNGVNEKLTGDQDLIQKLISQDWKYGRLESKNKGLIPINKEGKQKMVKPEMLSFYIKGGWIEGNPIFRKWIKETTIITNGKETIRVLKEEVNIYIQKGWRVGVTRTCDNSYKEKIIDAQLNTICVYKDGKTIKVKKDLVSKFIKDGWRKGNFSKIGKKGPNGNRKKINNGKICKFVCLQELQNWLNNGWILGKITV